MSKKQMIRRRGLCAFLAVMMCLEMLPVTALAAGEDDTIPVTVAEQDETDAPAAAEPDGTDPNQPAEYRLVYNNNDGKLYKEYPDQSRAAYTAQQDCWTGLDQDGDKSFETLQLNGFRFYSKHKCEMSSGSGIMRSALSLPFSGATLDIEGENVIFYDADGNTAYGGVLSTRNATVTGGGTIRLTATNAEHPRVWEATNGLAVKGNTTIILNAESTSEYVYGIEGNKDLSIEAGSRIEIGVTTNNKTPGTAIALAHGFIIADDSVVDGANETFISGVSGASGSNYFLLTQKDAANPVIIRDRTEAGRTAQQFYYSWADGKLGDKEFDDLSTHGQLTFTANGESKTIEQIRMRSPGLSELRAGDVVTVSAAPAEGYTLTGWTLVMGDTKFEDYESAEKYSIDTADDLRFVMPNKDIYAVVAHFAMDENARVAVYETVTGLYENGTCYVGYGKADQQFTLPAAVETGLLTDATKPQRFLYWYIGDDINTQYQAGDKITLDRAALHNNDDGELSFRIRAKTETDASRPYLTMQTEGQGTWKIACSDTSAMHGRNQSIYVISADAVVTLTPVPDEGYQFKEWQIVEGNVTVEDSKFTMPSTNVTVKAVFEARAASVRIDEENFPDANFRAVVESYDTDKDNTLSTDEIAQVKEINCKGRNITSLKGIEYFTKLGRLTCSDNALTALDLSKNPKLYDLTAGGNVREITLTGSTFDLSTLPDFDVNKTSNWEGGTVSGNILTVDDDAAVVTYTYDIGYTGTELEDRTAVFTLAIAGRGTDIAIDETNFPDKNFREILLSSEENIDRNQDGKLSTWEIALVRDMDLYEQKITELTGIKYFTALEYLDCAGNRLTSLDLSQNTKLTELDADNNAYTITPVNDTFYLADLPAGFDMAKTGNWQGGTVNGNILTINNDADEVTYDYDCGNGFTKTFTLEIPAQYTVTAHGLYGGTMGITPGKDYVARYTAGGQVDLQIGKRDGYTLQSLTLEGISENDLQWVAKDQESDLRGIFFEMPAHNVTVTVNWKANGSSSSGSSTAPSYPVSVDDVTNGTITITPKTASKGDTVTITVKPDQGYEPGDIKVIDQNGGEVKLTDKGNGQYTFTMPAGKVEIKAEFIAQTADSIFSDIPADAYYYEAVKWAADKNITGGIGDNLFAPNQPCTRAQIVTFLWRAAGSPEPKSTNHPFTDVPSGSYYEKAVLWAVENGITTGTSDTTFGPSNTCTRAQSVTFLYRAAGSPAVSGSAAFSDVPANAYYANAAAWAEQNGITGGIGNGQFGPYNDCTRAQIVTFLYRLYGSK